MVDEINTWLSESQGSQQQEDQHPLVQQLDTSSPLAHHP